MLMKIFRLALLVLLPFGAFAQGTLAEMDKAIISGAYPNIHSVLVAQDGKLAYERYFNGFNRDSLHDSRSSFKSVTSLLVGIAVDQHLIKSIDEKVHTFFPNDPIFAADSLRRQITIRNLLEMKAGFDCDEWNGEKDCESQMEKSQDWVRFSLSLPVTVTPGTQWAYTSCAPMIISGIIEKVAGMSVMQFAEKYLFSPLAIIHYRWTIDPAGHGMTAGSFYMKPADMLKIGQMVLNGGKWGNKRIVSHQWIEQSTRATTLIPDGSFVKTSRSAAAIAQPCFYGFYWYNEVIRTGTGDYPVIFASGNGGQYIIIVPRLRKVVVFTQGNYGSRTAKQAFDILARYILP